MRALVLSGGGCKGAFEVGALKKWMHEDGTDYEILTGISVGAINSTYLAQFPVGQGKQAWEVLKSLWDQVTPAKVKKNWIPLWVIESLWKQSVYNSAPLQQWIRGGLDPAKVKASGKQLRIVAVSWDSGESRVVDQNASPLPDWVIASSAFPVMLSPISIEGQLWADGGLRSVTPLGEAIKAGATDIDVIICSDPYAKDSFSSKGKAAIPSLSLRAIDILTDEIMRADLKICGLKNDLVALGHPTFKKINLRVLVPPMDLGDSLNFDQANIQRMENIGYEAACKLV
jgi:NTE family protein